MSVVRRAEAKDAASLAALAEHTFRAAFGAQNTRANMDAHCANAYGAAIQASEIAAPEVETFLCEDNLVLAGYAQLRWGAAPPCVPALKPAEIQRIYVDPHWHGKGVAHALMTQMFMVAERGGADQIWLGVWEKNPRATAFYRKFGFNQVGQHAFRLGEDVQNDWIFCRDVRLAGATLVRE